jgi:hypothetical protein
MPKRRTSAQRAASRKNLEAARRSRNRKIGSNVTAKSIVPQGKKSKNALQAMNTGNMTRAQFAKLPSAVKANIGLRKRSAKPMVFGSYKTNFGGMKTVEDAGTAKLRAQINAPKRRRRRRAKK